MKALNFRKALHVNEMPREHHKALTETRENLVFTGDEQTPVWFETLKLEEFLDELKNDPPPPLYNTATINRYKALLKWLQDNDVAVVLYSII